MTTTKNKQDGEFEEAVYNILDEAFQRADGAAKAIARLEYDLVVSIVPEATEDQAVARESNRNIDRSVFEQLFTTINMIKFTSDLLDVIQLDQHKEQIIQALISQQFPTETVTEKSTADKTVVGTELGLLLHQLRGAAEQRQRSKQREEKQ